jgi:cysteine desulfurase
VLEPIIRGGGQERGFRSGTENVAAICGLAKAFEIALDPKRQAKEASRIADLRDDLIAGLRQIFKENIFFNGSLVSSERIPNNVNISLPDRDTEFLLIQLDAQGISCSTKSSCLRDEDESYVIHALKDFEVGSKSDTTHDARASHSLRFSLGRSTTKKDINTTLKTLEQIIGNSL